MKTVSKTYCRSKICRSTMFNVMMSAFVLISFTAFAQETLVKGNREVESLSLEIKAQLIDCRNLLNYPNSVERFYKLQHYKFTWVAKNNYSIQLDPAMMLLNCVLQFGLNNSDFHPTELLYRQIQILKEQPNLLGDNRRAIFDVLLTDAMLTFINQLHYGKFNPSQTPSKIDFGGVGDLDAVSKLSQLLKSDDFYTEIINVQPMLKEYNDLQRHMHLVRGQYMEDNYEFAEEKVRKMAINMERLRWLTKVSTPSLFINIPAYTAKLKVKDSTYLFKVTVGKSSSPTPIVESSITHFTVAPDRKLSSKIFLNKVLPNALKYPNYLQQNHYAIYNANGKFVEITRKNLLYIQAHPHAYFARQSVGCDNASGKVLFYFANPNSTYLYDLTQPNSFLSTERAISNGCVGIDQAEKMASLLLVQDGTPSKIPSMHKFIKAYQKKEFWLKKTAPIKLVYLTCEMIDSQLVIYKDIYAQDKRLENAMYGGQPVLVLERKTIDKP